jgi:signal transduction histidine kinase
MFRSLKGHLTVLLVLLTAAAVAASVLMVGLFRQSATAQVGQADAQIGRACDAIAAAYRFYSTEWRGSVAALDDERFRGGMTTVVQTALRNRPGIEGGIWQATVGSLAYAFPTYEGSGPKTDLPQAELPRIQDVNRAALAEERQASSRYPASSQTLLVTACSLPGPIPELTAWAMTRVVTSSGRAYRQLMAGLGILLTAVIAAAVLSSRLAWTWSRHISRIEQALAAHDIAALPTLSITGERELDRIVSALNDAGTRLTEARRRAEDLAREIATSERLAAIGRVAAGVAHEIRNPIAAMKLKAENALAAGSDRSREALSVVLGQIDRLEQLVRRLLNVAQREVLRAHQVALGPFLDKCLAEHADLARARQLRLESRLGIGVAHFDPDQMERAVENLILNALQAAPAGTQVLVSACMRDDQLVVSVRDQGPGPPRGIRDHVFEPFVTGRPDGTGLGLSIVREVAEAHGGTVRFTMCDRGTTFEIMLPWPPS